MNIWPFRKRLSHADAASLRQTNALLNDAYAHLLKRLAECERSHPRAVDPVDDE